MAMTGYLLSYLSDLLDILLRLPEDDLNITEYRRIPC